MKGPITLSFNRSGGHQVGARGIWYANATFQTFLSLPHRVGHCACKVEDPSKTPQTHGKDGSNKFLAIHEYALMPHIIFILWHEPIPVWKKWEGKESCANECISLTQYLAVSIMLVKCIPRKGYCCRERSHMAGQVERRSLEGLTRHRLAHEITH